MLMLKYNVYLEVLKLSFRGLTQDGLNKPVNHENQSF